MSPRPRLQALLLAEHVYTDASTGKRIIAGTFNSIAVAEFPTYVALPAYAYISVTDVRTGKADLVLRFISNEDLSVLMELGPLPVRVKDIHETIEIGIPIPGFPLPNAGIYDFELHADGERLGCLRITATLPPAQS